MDGDVLIDLSKPSFRGTGIKRSKITRDYACNVEILCTAVYVHMNKLQSAIDYRVIVKYQYHLIAKYNNV